MFSQYEAFKTYCEIYPHNAVLVDTYNTLKSGVLTPSAFNEVLKPPGRHHAASGWTPAISPISPSRPGRHLFL